MTACVHQPIFHCVGIRSQIFAEQAFHIITFDIRLRVPSFRSSSISPSLHAHRSRHQNKGPIASQCVAHEPRLADPEHCLHISHAPVLSWGASLLHFQNKLISDISLVDQRRFHQYGCRRSWGMTPKKRRATSVRAIRQRPQCVAIPEHIPLSSF